MSKRTTLVVPVEFYIPDEIRSKLDKLKISPEIQEEALNDAIFTYVQERFLVDEEEEIIEHVKDRQKFLFDISELSRFGGLVIFTTINKSILGVALGKYLAEHVLGVVPKGTHDYKKFISPNDLASEAEKHKIILDNFTGFAPTFNIKNLLDKEFGNFKLSSNLEVNYGAAGLNLKSNDLL